MNLIAICRAKQAVVLLMHNLLLLFFLYFLNRVEKSRHVDMHDMANLSLQDTRQVAWHIRHKHVDIDHAHVRMQDTLCAKQGVS